MRQAKRDHWTPIVKDWAQSGLNQAAYCRQNKINADLFRFYKRQLDIEVKSKPKTEAVGFARAVISTPTAEPFILQVSLTSGATITGIHANNIDLVKVLLGAD